MGRMSDEPARIRYESRWQATVAVLAVAGLYSALPRSLAVGPWWLQLILMLALLVPVIVAHQLGYQRVNHVLGVALQGVITIFMVWSLLLLVKALPSRREAAVPMLRSAAALWLTNVLVFAMWYWRLDAGGP